MNFIVKKADKKSKKSIIVTKCREKFKDELNIPKSKIFIFIITKKFLLFEHRFISNSLKLHYE